MAENSGAGSSADPSLPPNACSTACNTQQAKPKPKPKQVKPAKGKSPKVKQPSRSEDVSKRLDKLEGLLEHLVANIYEPQSTLTEDGEIVGDSNTSLGNEATNVQPNDTQPRPGCSGSDLGSVDIITAEEQQNAVISPVGFASRYAVPSEEGDPLSTDLAGSLNYLLSTKLEEKQLSDLFQTYAKPSNCDFLQVPKINPIIWDNINAKTRSVDLKIQRCQRPLVKGLISLTRSLDGDKRPLTELEQDCMALLANAHFELNSLRKELIKPDLHHRYSHLCKPEVKPTQWLFGSDLPKAVRNLDEEQKAVGVVKHPKLHVTHRFRPYRAPVSTNRQRYTEAGWYTRPRYQASKPFLGAWRSHVAQKRGQNPHKPSANTKPAQANTSRQSRRI